MFDDFFVRALIAGIGVAIVTGPLGCFVIWRRLSYFGDTLSHSALIGVTIAFSFSINISLSVFIVSSIIEVVIPLNIANIIMLIVDQPESVNMNWNAAIVPRSPMEQPIKHHMVLYADLLHTLPSVQVKSIGTTSTTVSYTHLRAHET